MTKFIELIKDHDTGMYEIYETDGDLYDEPIVKGDASRLIKVIASGIKLATRNKQEFRIPARMISKEDGYNCTNPILHSTLM